MNTPRICPQCGLSVTPDHNCMGESTVMGQTRKILDGLAKMLDEAGLYDSIDPGMATQSTGAIKIEAEPIMHYTIPGLRWLHNQSPGYGHKPVLQVWVQECLGFDENGVGHYSGRGEWVTVPTVEEER